MKQEFVQKYTRELTGDKQKKVFEILVCPIVATKSIKKIGMYLKEDKSIIISPQSCGSNPDEDMCDLSIGFYEILYGLEKGAILQQPKSADGWNLAGDTMNSFKFISAFSSDQKRQE